MAFSPYSLLFNDACSDGEHYADAHDERRLRQEGDGSGGSDGRTETPDTGAAEGSCSIVRSYGAFTLTEGNTVKMANVGVALCAERLVYTYRHRARVRHLQSLTLCQWKQTV